MRGKPHAAVSHLERVPEADCTDVKSCTFQSVYSQIKCHVGAHDVGRVLETQCHGSTTKVCEDQNKLVLG